MAAHGTYDDVKLSAERLEDQGIVSVFVQIGDVKIPIGAMKLGDFDERLTRAAEAKVSTQQTSEPE